MEKKPIFITETDLKRLRALADDFQRKSAAVDVQYIRDLLSELDRATIVKPEEIPGDVVTLHSKVKLLDLKTKEEEIYTLVYPEEADAAENKISILAPIGTAILGYRAGDIFEWPVPQGIRQLKVLEVLYQPEREGHFHL